MHFKKPLMLLMDANSKKSILINNAYYRLNLPKGLKTKTLQMKKREPYLRLEVLSVC